MKQFNISFIVNEKSKRLVQKTYIVTEKTYNEVMDLVNGKIEKCEP